MAPDCIWIVWEPGLPVTWDRCEEDDVTRDLSPVPVSATTNIHTTDIPFRTDNQFEKDLSEALPAEPDELLQLEKQYNGPYCTLLGEFQHIKENGLVPNSVMLPHVLVAPSM